MRQRVAWTCRQRAGSEGEVVWLTSSTNLLMSLLFWLKWADSKEMAQVMTIDTFI